MDEHYTQAKSTMFSGWYDSELRDYLVQHGWLKTDAQAKREEVSHPQHASRAKLKFVDGQLDLPEVQGHHFRPLPCLARCETPSSAQKLRYRRDQIHYPTFIDP